MVATKLRNIDSFAFKGAKMQVIENTLAEAV